MQKSIKIHVTEVGGCPLKKVLEESGMEPTEEPNYYATLGTLIHKVSEVVFQSIIEGNGTVPFEEAIDISKEDYESFYITNEWEVHERAEKLYTWLEQEVLDGSIYKVRSTEEKFLVPLGTDIDHQELILTGTADLTLEKDDGTVEVVDLKSGKTRSKKHAWQVSAYAYLLEELHDVKVSSARIVYLGADFAEKRYKNGKVTRKHERVLTRDDIDNYYADWRNTLDAYIHELRDAWGNDMSAEEEHKDCFFCQFKSYCWGEY